MQSAKLEFLSFDAADVIATSGVMTAYFTLSTGLFSGTDHLNIHGNCVEFVMPGFDYSENCINFFTFSGGQIGTITPVGGYMYMISTANGYGDVVRKKGNIDATLINAEVVTSAQAGWQELSSLEAIAQWCENNLGLPF